MPSYYDNLELCRYLNLPWVILWALSLRSVMGLAQWGSGPCNCGPWWGKAGDLDLGMHWWLVRTTVFSKKSEKVFFIWHPSSGVWQGIAVKTLCCWILKVLAILGMAGLFAVMKILVVTLADLLFEKLLISGHQDLCQSHYAVFYNSYLWKLLAGLHFSFGVSCEQPLAMSWVCYPCDQNTTAKGSMGRFSLCLKLWRWEIVPQLLPDGDPGLGSGCF